MEWSRLIHIKWFVRFKEREQVTKKMIMMIRTTKEDILPHQVLQ